MALHWLHTSGTRSDDVVHRAGPASPAPASRRRLWLAALALVVLALAVAHLPILWGQVVFFRDLAHWNFPSRWFLRTSLLAAEWPAWDPLRGLGISAQGNPLYSVFYPPNWLYAAGGTTVAAGMLTWQCLAHLVWGGAGTFQVAKRLGAQPTGAFVSAVAWGLCGYTTSQWSAGFLLFADAWIPWTTLGALTLLDEARARRGLASLWKAALPVAASVLLGEIFLATIGAGFAFCLALGLDRVRAPAHGARSDRGRTAFVLALGLGLGMVLGAVVLIPAWLGSRGTERGVPLSTAVAEACSLHPLRLIEMVAPWSMGNPYTFYPAGPWVGEPGMGGLPLSQSVYLGGSVVALALAGLGSARSIEEPAARRLRYLLLGLALATLCVAMGKHTPAHALLRAVVRPLAYMRYPEKYFVLPVLLCGWLTGLGATGQDPPGPQPGAGRSRS